AHQLSGQRDPAARGGPLPAPGRRAAPGGQQLPQVPAADRTAPGPLRHAGRGEGVSYLPGTARAVTRSSRGRADIARAHAAASRTSAGRHEAGPTGKASTAAGDGAGFIPAGPQTSGLRPTVSLGRMPAVLGE